MQVLAGGTSGSAGYADRLPGWDRLVTLDEDIAQVGVQGMDVTMFQLDTITVTATITRIDHEPGKDSVDEIVMGGKVYSVVELHGFGERIFTVTEVGGRLQLVHWHADHRLTLEDLIPSLNQFVFDGVQILSFVSFRKDKRSVPLDFIVGKLSRIDWDGIFHCFVFFQTYPFANPVE